MSNFRRLYNKFYKKKLSRLSVRLYWKKKEAELKNYMQKNSHSLLWVWEFSKKAVLICFLFYIVVQVYSMAVMVIYCDFTYLGELISQTGQIVRDCVFAYLVKAGVENIGKIFCSRNKDKTEEDNSNEDEPVG